MRLWTLHPKYLDAKGLVALWREALLAQAVLRGETRGYLHHPQLVRFRESAFPLACIARYLQGVHEESLLRGYSFDPARIGRAEGCERMVATRGQLEYEWSRLKAKLERRSPSWLTALGAISTPAPHPLFQIVPGPVEKWEVVRE